MTQFIGASSEQVEADKFDMELFRLIGRAEYAMNTSTNKKLWQQAIRQLNAARTPVREMMHPEDKRATL